MSSEALASEGEVFNISQLVHIDVDWDFSPFYALYLWMTSITVAAPEANVRRSLVTPPAVAVPEFEWW